MISVVILTKNEEHNIIDCLESVAFADEILIIDDYSTDKTIDVIRHLKNPKISIFERKLNGDFSTQRNFGLEKAKRDWVLFLDADERVNDELAFEISNLNSPIGSHLAAKINGFYIKRTDVIWGKQLRYGETGKVKFLRLARKNTGKWVGMVHEKWIVKGNISGLKNSLLHYSHPTINSFLHEINFYTDIRANELFGKKVKVRCGQIIAYPCVKFFLNFFIKRGFKDGLTGFVFAVLMSFHSFLARAKLWQLWQE